MNYPKKVTVPSSPQTACIFNIQKFSIHDGPGIRTVVFFKGCPLRCTWCANPESQNAFPEQMWDKTKQEYVTQGKDMTVDEVLTEVMKDLPFYEESGGGVTLSGGEVLYQATFAKKLLAELKQQNVHTAIETTAWTNPLLFQDFIKDVDYLMIDLKHYDSAAHREGTKVKNEIILENLRIAKAAGKEVLIRIPVIPDYNDSLEDARHFSQLIASIGLTDVNLLPFHQFGENKYELLEREYAFTGVRQYQAEDLDDYRQIFLDEGLNCYF